jgi:hypothetical protein
MSEKPKRLIPIIIPNEEIIILPECGYNLRSFEMDIQTRRVLLRKYGILFPTNSEISYDFRNLVIGEDKKNNILVAYNPQRNYLLFASPKQGAPKTADFLILHPRGYGFIGDGVSPVSSPPSEILQEMIEKFDVPKERPDSFFLQLFKMRGISFLPDVSPRDILNIINEEVKRALPGKLPISREYVCRLPHLVGTAFRIDPYLSTTDGYIVGIKKTDGKLNFEVIGDGVVIVEGPHGSLTTFQSQENSPFDQETLQRLERLLQQNEKLTVDQARQLPEFISYLQSSYERKLNQLGGVRAINGVLPVFPQLSVSIGIDQVKQILISTDGVFLGSDPLSTYRRFFLNLGFDDGSDGRKVVTRVLGILAEIKQEQISRYKAQNQTRHIIQEKPSDDWCGLIIRFPTTPIMPTYLSLKDYQTRYPSLIIFNKLLE